MAQNAKPPARTGPRLLSRPKLKLNANVTFEITDPYGTITPSGDDEHQHVTWKAEVTNSGSTKLDILTSDAVLQTADGQQFFLIGYQPVSPRSSRKVNLSYEVPVGAVPEKLTVRLGGGSVDIKVA